jgi:hypothetical protein
MALAEGGGADTVVSFPKQRQAGMWLKVKPEA